MKFWIWLIIITSLVTVPVQAKWFRAVSIRVIDEETKEPLSGIDVQYRIRTNRTHSICLIPLIWSDGSFYERLNESYQTDAEGRVQIKGRWLFMGPYEFPWERFYFNFGKTALQCFEYNDDDERLFGDDQGCYLCRRPYVRIRNDYHTATVTTYRRHPFGSIYRTKYCDEGYEIDVYQIHDSQRNTEEEMVIELRPTENGTKQKSELYNAIILGDVTALKQILSEGIDVNISFHDIQDDNNPHTPLTLAAWRGQKEVVEMLLDNGASVDLGDSSIHRSPLGWAAGGSHPELPWSSIGTHAEVVRILIEHGADVNKYAGLGSSPLIRAAEAGNTEIVNFLLDQGAQVDKYFFYRTSSTNALVENNIEIAGMLIEKGAQIAYWDHVMRQEKCGKAGVVEQLLNLGIDVNQADLTSFTALISAVASNNIELVRMLLQSGADINATRYEDDKNALWYAKKGKYQDIIRLLKQHSKK